jgi:hypothetical protein
MLVVSMVVVEVAVVVSFARVAAPSFVLSWADWRSLAKAAAPSGL